MNNIKTIRYMGNKTKLLNDILPIIYENYTDGTCICDLMAGTNSVAYALKDKYKIITNDVERYSKVISDSIITNKDNVVVEKLRQDLSHFYEYNMVYRKYSFFEENYSDKYFSGDQCAQIDSIRYAIDMVRKHKNQLLTALMYSMNLAQSTPGHFAQFLPPTHSRVVYLRGINILDVFFEKLEEFEKIPISHLDNKSFCMDYKLLLETQEINSVKLFYIDTPYTGEQYSRFYHILDTIVKYDNPKIAFKAGYRDDRFKSSFSYKTKVEEEFNYMIGKIYSMKKDILLSYSNKGLIEVNVLMNLFGKYYQNVTLKEIAYNHSTQGKGSTKVNEVLILAKY